MSFKDYTRAILRYWWIVLTCLVVGVGISAVITAGTTKLYATTVTFFVKTPADQLSGAVQGDTFGQKRVNSYVELATTDRLIKPVLADTKLTLSPSALAGEIAASGDADTVLLTVTVTDPSPQQSLKIGSSIATQFVSLVAELESSSSVADTTVRLELVSGPTLHSTPVAPHPLFNYAIGVVLGLIMGIALAIAREVLDTSVRTAHGLENYAHAPVVGIIGFDDTAKENPLIVEGHAKSIRAEAFRQLRTNLEFSNVDDPPRIIVVTSSVANEGKSSTATNLAVIFAEAGKKVLLVEGDLRRPRVADYLGIEGSIGLTNVLAGQVAIDDVLQSWGRGGLTVLPSGSVPPNPSELLGSNNMAAMLRSLAQRFDVILIDSPPLLPVTDAAVLAARADGALLVVHHGHTTRQQVAAAAGSLSKVDARLLGCVLNMVPLHSGDSYSYGYGYEAYESAPSSRPSLAEAAADGARLKSVVNKNSAPQKSAV